MADESRELEAESLLAPGVSGANEAANFIRKSLARQQQQQQQPVNRNNTKLTVSLPGELEAGRRWCVRGRLREGLAEGQTSSFVGLGARCAGEVLENCPSRPAGRFNTISFHCRRVSRWSARSNVALSADCCCFNLRWRFFAAELACWEQTSRALSVSSIEHSQVCSRS